jgi:ABC-2 type transport system permease protein
MRNILLIARREYLEQIRGRAFKYSTILLPLGILALLAGIYFMGRNAGAGKHIAIAADSAPLAGDMRRQLLDDKAAKLTVDVVAPATQQDCFRLRIPPLDRRRSLMPRNLPWISELPAG